ncbi:MAG TPA: PLP-dependent transferase [Abditibacteriaceae bacterium]
MTRPESPETSELHADTVLVHSGDGPDAVNGSVAPVLVRSKTYRQPCFGEDAAWKYSRGTNPTRAALEAKLADIEGEGQATVYGSGLAAITILLLTLESGDHVLFSREIYGGTYRLLDQVFNRFGLTFGFADFSSEQEVQEKITPKTRYLFVETPSNPSLHVTDLQLAGDIAKATGIPLLVDGTFSPPVTTRAFDFGAETIVYSLSKYFAGHNDVIGGAILTRNAELHTRLKFLQSSVGAILSPDECYRVIQGLKTLHLRWERTCFNALKLAEYLQGHPAIKRTLYPGLPTHPLHEVAARQMSNGFGGVVAFETHCGDQGQLRQFIESLQARDTVIYGESLASPETILSYPIQMSHRSLPAEDLAALEITDGFFRLSLGFEHAEDLIEDFRRSLALL